MEENVKGKSEGWGEAERGRGGLARWLGLQHYFRKKRLRELGLFSVGKRRQRGHSNSGLQSLKNSCKNIRTMFFLVVADSQ